MPRRRLSRGECALLPYRGKLETGASRFLRCLGLWTIGPTILAQMIRSERRKQAMVEADVHVVRLILHWGRELGYQFSAF